MSRTNTTQAIITFGLIANATKPQNKTQQRTEKLTYIRNELTLLGRKLENNTYQIKVDILPTKKPVNFNPR